MAIIENYKMRIGWERIGHFPTNFSFSQQIATNWVSEFSMHRIGKTNDALHRIKSWLTSKGC